jgi:hypothetical protein
MKSLRLVLLVAACQQTPKPPPVPAAVTAPRDARVADARAIDAKMIGDIHGASDAARPTVTLPDFGCLAWSAARGMVACVIGNRGSNYGESVVELVFLPLRADAQVPDPISLLHTADNERGPDELPPQITAKLDAALAGLTALDHGASSLVWKREYSNTGDRVITGRAAMIGGFSIQVRFDRDGTDANPPQYHLVLAATRGSDRRLLDDQRGSISGVTVRAYALGGTVIVESVWGIAEEGTYATNGSVWRCTASDCQGP